MKRPRHIMLALTTYYPDLHAGIVRYAREHGWHLDASVTLTRTGRRGWSGDGIIMGQPLGMDDWPDGRFLSTLDQPRVVLARDVRCDHAQIGRMAAEYLIDRGLPHYAWLWSSEHPRADAYRHALEERGIKDCRAIRISQKVPWETRFMRLQRQLERLPRPLGLFAMDDIVGVEAVEAALAAGLRVPEDIAVLGVDNMELICEACAPPLSSIDIDLNGTGYQAAAMLDALLDGQPLPSQPVLIQPRGVVTRQSTDILAVACPNVAKALRFIWANYTTDIRITDVVAATALSERSLYDAFNRHLHTPIKHHIQRARIAHARQMLLETNETIDTVAIESGFHDVRRLHAAFRLAVGATPAAWRKRYRAG